MVCGIYVYEDLMNEKNIIYVGQSKNCERRHKQHLTPSSYSGQKINSILQNNPNRYNFKIIELCEVEELNEKEIFYIAKYNPPFNFTKGGDTLPRKIKDYARVIRGGKNNWNLMYKGRKIKSNKYKERLDFLAYVINLCPHNPNIHHYPIIVNAGFNKGKKRYQLKTDKVLATSIDKNTIKVKLFQYVLGILENEKHKKNTYICKNSKKKNRKQSYALLIGSNRVKTSLSIETLFIEGCKI